MRSEIQCRREWRSGRSTGQGRSPGPRAAASRASLSISRSSARPLLGRRSGVAAGGSHRSATFDNQSSDLKPNSRNPWPSSRNATNPLVPPFPVFTSSLTSTLDPTCNPDHEQHGQCGETTFRNRTNLLHGKPPGIGRVLDKANVIDRRSQLLIAEHGGWERRHSSWSPADRARDQRPDLSVSCGAFLPAKASTPPRSAVRWQAAQYIRKSLPPSPIFPWHQRDHRKIGSHVVRHRLDLPGGENPGEGRHVTRTAFDGSHHFAQIVFRLQRGTSYSHRRCNPLALVSVAFGALLGKDRRAAGSVPATICAPRQDRRRATLPGTSTANQE